MTLSATQSHPITRRDRSLGLGGTDAMRIMAGDWQRLYLEKIGEIEAEDLSAVFKVQLGTFTESLHIDWFERQTGLAVIRQSETFVHPDHPFIMGNIDGWIPEERALLEVKHTRNGASAWDKARFYMPQLQHYMLIVGCDRAYFSIIPGNDEPKHVIVDRDDQYIRNLIKMETSFWWHVTNKVVPDIAPTGELARINKDAESIKVDKLRIADMATVNMWSDAAGRFVSYQNAAREFDLAKEDLKALIADDVGEAYGHGVVAKRDKRGRITIKASKGAANDNA